MRLGEGGGGDGNIRKTVGMWPVELAHWSKWCLSSPISVSTEIISNGYGKFRLIIPTIPLVFCSAKSYTKDTDGNKISRDTILVMNIIYFTSIAKYVY